MRTLALLLLLVASMAPASSASECSALTQNVLTSAACPSDCVLGSCVLYSPSQDSCKYYNSTGGCLSQEDFVLNGTPCNMTYQCMNSLFDSSKNLWFLSLLDIKNSKNLAVAPVTEVHDLTYPTNSVTVQFSGTLTKSDRTDVKNVVVDDSFFKTPDKSLSFYVTGINLRSALAKADFTGRKWTRVAFSSANLDAVPPGLSQLTGLQMVDLSKNFITSIKDATPFKKVDTLSLQYNDLTDLTVDLPSIATLNLSGNPLGKIPDAIFGMRSLQTLSMRACQLTNVHLNESQYTFLSQLRSFDADATSINCTDGFKVETMASGVTVCIPDTTSAPEKSGGGGSSNTIIIVVVVVVGVLVVAAVAFLCMRRKRRPIPGDKVNTPTFGTTTGTYTGMTDGTDIWNDPDLMAVRIDYSAVEPIKLLSRGGFGEVWLGLYMNENVAIKRLLTEKRTVKDAMAFAAEIKIMARLDHPKIVRFIGVAWTNTLSIQAVTEFMDCGDLRSLLDSSRASTLTWANIKCQIAIDVADALVYMHTLNPKLIHRDLKSRNVLIDAHSGAKLSDFGISRNRSVEETMTAGVGTARWIAPEVIAGGHYTEFADIYSFGIVLTEIDTCKTPYHDAVNTNGAKMQDVTILQQVSAGKLQPSMTNSCPTAIVALARACMSFDPASRPSAIHIAYELRKILKEL